MGADQAYIDQALAQLPADDSAGDDFEVYPENWDALLLFLALQTQWRTGGMGGRLGLDYPAVEVVMRLRQVSDQAGMFSHLQAMEIAALDAEGEADDGQ